MSGAEFPYLAGYPAAIIDQVRELAETGALQKMLRSRYPDRSEVANDRALREYVVELKNRFIKRSPPLSRIAFDDRLTASHGALGMHTFVSRVHGKKTVAKNELRIASAFKTLPEDFLRMVVVHELAHLKEKEHNKSFYKLCCHMEPRYHQLELDLRIYLTVFGDSAKRTG